MRSFNIGHRRVGYDCDPLVIAEIGINHNGNLDLAKIMVDSAARAGAEIIKHQTHVIEDEMSHHAKRVIPGNTDISIYDVMANCALNEDEEIELQRYVESKGLLFISTPFSRAAAERLERMNIPAYKIGSGECNNYPLIKHIAGFKKPIILSTGMNSIESIQTAVDIFETAGCPYALLHCTNIYPTPYELVRLGALSEMQAQFPNAVIGLSDHTVDNYACLGAVALGACILERHYTDRKDREGPDIVCSMDESELQELIKGAIVMAKLRGGNKGLIAGERVTADFAFASIVSIAPIREGEIFTMDNVWIKRPGTGELLADAFDSVLGKRCLRTIATDTQLRRADVAW